jgi:hypothetical protein
MTLPATEPIIPLPVADSPEKAAGSGHGADAAAAPVIRDDQMPTPAGSTTEEAGTIRPLSSRMAAGDLTISRDRWMDIIKWAHHTESIGDEQRKDLLANLMRLSKLVQKGRHLTNRQEQEIRVLVARVQGLGYRFV